MPGLQRSLACAPCAHAAVRPSSALAEFPQILFHSGNCSGYGVSIIALFWLQISALDEFGDHLVGERLTGSPNDVAHG